MGEFVKDHSHHDSHIHGRHDLHNMNVLNDTTTAFINNIINFSNSSIKNHNAHNHDSHLSTDLSLQSANHGDASGHHGSGGHSMAFHFGHDQVLFFNAWQISSPMTLVYACVGIFIFSVLYEGLKVFREHLMSYPVFASPAAYINDNANKYRYKGWRRLLNYCPGVDSHRGRASFNGSGKGASDIVRHKKGCCAGKQTSPPSSCHPSSIIAGSGHGGEGDHGSTDTPYTKIPNNGITPSDGDNVKILTGTADMPQANVYSEFNTQGYFKSCDCKSNTSFSLPDHVIQSVLHMVQTCLGFLLMLVFMTFNVWLCAALIFGAGFGYFCFAWKRRIAIVDVTQHCN